MIIDLDTPNTIIHDIHDLPNQHDPRHRRCTMYGPRTPNCFAYAPHHPSDSAQTSSLASYVARSFGIAIWEFRTDRRRRRAAISLSEGHIGGQSRRRAWHIWSPSNPDRAMLQQSIRTACSQLSPLRLSNTSQQEQQFERLRCQEMKTAGTSYANHSNKDHSNNIASSGRTLTLL